MNGPVVGRKILKANFGDKDHCEYWFHCPGCKFLHVFVTQWGPRHLKNRELRGSAGAAPLWSFNDNLEKPTFAPSLLYIHEGDGMPRCHLFLTDGILHFLNDCGHALAGKQIPLADCEDV